MQIYLMVFALLTLSFHPLNATEKEQNYRWDHPNQIRHIFELPENAFLDEHKERLTKLRQLSRKQVTFPDRKAMLLLEMVRMRLENKLDEVSFSCITTYNIAKSIAQANAQEYGQTGPLIVKHAKLYQGWMYCSGFFQDMEITEPEGISFIHIIKELLPPTQAYELLSHTKDNTSLPQNVCLTADLTQINLWYHVMALRSDLFPHMVFSRLVALHQNENALVDIRKESQFMIHLLRFNNIIGENLSNGNEACFTIHMNTLESPLSTLSEKISAAFTLSDMRYENRLRDDQMDLSTVYETYWETIGLTTKDERHGVFKDQRIKAVINMAHLECRNLGTKNPAIVKEYSDILCGFIGNVANMTHHLNLEANLAAACLQASAVIPYPMPVNPNPFQGFVTLAHPLLFESPQELYNMFFICAELERRIKYILKIRLYKAIMLCRGEITDPFNPSPKGLLESVIQSYEVDPEDKITAQAWLDKL